MNKYVGPIGWDIGGERTATAGADWACWQENPKLTSKACGDLYLSEIATVGRGIVLMHDADYGGIDNHSITSGTGCPCAEATVKRPRAAFGSAALPVLTLGPLLQPASSKAESRAGAARR